MFIALEAGIQPVLPMALSGHDHAAAGIPANGGADILQQILQTMDTNALGPLGPPRIGIRSVIGRADGDMV